MFLRSWNSIVNDNQEETEHDSDNISGAESGDEKNISDKNKNKNDDDNDNEKKIKNPKRIKVFDRFTMILQIFAKRAETRIAKLQVII